MYLLVYTLQHINHLTLEEAKAEAIQAREEGKGSAILTDEEANDRFSPMQDLTSLKEWS